MRKKKNISMTKVILVSALTPILLFLLLCAGEIALSIIYASNGSKALLVTLIIYSAIVLPLLGLLSYLSIRFFRKTYLEGLVRTTEANMEKIATGDATLSSYPMAGIDEFESLNQSVQSLKSTLEGSTFIAKQYDYDVIPFDYLNDKKNLVTLASMEKAMGNLVYLSQNYRNFLGCVYYELGEESLTDEEVDTLLSCLEEQFKDYPHVLFALDKKKQSLYFFLPRIDSISCIKEQVEACIPSISVNRRTAEGMVNIPGKFAGVVYPSSELGDLLSDLSYARRQGKASLIYQPNRLQREKATIFAKSSMNLNMMSKIMGNLGALEPSNVDIHTGGEAVRRAFRDLSLALGVDHAGLISFDYDQNAYESLYHIGTSPFFFDEGNIIDDRFILAFQQAKEVDGSFYFSTISHVSGLLRPTLDTIGISGGFVYVLEIEGKPEAVIYFMKRDGAFEIDSYLQETLMIASQRIGAYQIASIKAKAVYESERQLNAVLLLSNYSLYRVDRTDYRILSLSNHIRSVFPKAKVGEKCYKCLYGLDKPCSNCPVKTGAKMISESGKKVAETSLFLNEKESRSTNMLVHLLKNGELSAEPFHKDLLICSFSSLAERLEGYYSIADRGNLLLLRIDNMDDVLSGNGPDLSMLILRNFISRVRGTEPHEENIFYYNSHCIAILFPHAGQIDVVDECEKIYELSKQPITVGKKSIILKLTYLVTPYPSGYPTPQDYLRNVDRFYEDGQYKAGLDLIYFSDSSYVRSASRTAFMLSVIESQFGNSTYSVKMQPMVSAADRKIFGAEFLLRIADDYRKIVFNADELVRVAVANNKISLITRALLNDVASVYEQYGAAIFRILGFRRLSLNTDYSFFSDPNFFKEMDDLVTRMHMPKGFVGLEVPEQDISNHLSEFQAMKKQLSDLDASLVCDRYSGRYLSMKVLKKLGFNEIKIDRWAVNHIDTDQSKLNNIRQLLEEAKEAGVKVTLVGVENSDQFRLIKSIDPDCYVQGYYFYQPLDKNALIDAIRDTNGIRK